MTAEANAAAGRPVRIGILGAAWIAPSAVVTPAQRIDGVEVIGVAARERARAQTFAAKWNLPTTFRSYDAVIESDDVDAVYIPLPVSFHAEWALSAVAAGKHVLVEKPFARNEVEAQIVVDAGARAGVVVAEAFHYRYHPAMQRLIDLVASAALGKVERIEAAFEFDVFAAAKDMAVYTAPELGGGALYHLGAYCLHFCRSVLATEPEVVAVSMRLGETEVDASTVVDLRFPHGIDATISSQIDAPNPRMFGRVVGSDGAAELRGFVVPHLYSEGDLLHVREGETQYSERPRGDSTYFHQLLAFRDAIVHGTPMLTSGGDTVASMRLVDQVRSMGMDSLLRRL